jgi:hypothetical protein
MCDFDGAVWCHLVQDVVQRWAFVNMEMSIWNFIKDYKFLDEVGRYRFFKEWNFRRMSYLIYKPSISHWDISVGESSLIYVRLQVTFSKLTVRMLIC